MDAVVSLLQQLTIKCSWAKAVALPWNAIKRGCLSMFAFFNQRNEWRLAGQITNVAALALAALDLVNHPATLNDTFQKIQPMRALNHYF